HADPLFARRFVAVEVEHHGEAPLAVELWLVRDEYLSWRGGPIPVAVGAEARVRHSARIEPAVALWQFHLNIRRRLAGYPWGRLLAGYRLAPSGDRASGPLHVGLA